MSAEPGTEALIDRYVARYPALVFDEPAERILRITLAGKGRVNALTEQQHTDLAEIWTDIDRDARVGAVILRGGQSAFCSGGDFEMVRGMIEDWEKRASKFKETVTLVNGMVNCSKPIISGINGIAIGAGLSLALLSDIPIAARSATIIDGHTRLGVPAGDHAALIWPLLCGMAKAKYYVMTCEEISAEEAERLGLVSLCVDDDELESRTIEVACRVAAYPAFAMSWTKHTMNNFLRQNAPSFDASLAMEMMAFSGPDIVSGMRNVVGAKNRPTPTLEREDRGPDV